MAARHCGLGPAPVLALRSVLCQPGSATAICNTARCDTLWIHTSEV